MNYIWEAVLSADLVGIGRENLKFIPVRNGSPYTEVVLEHINSGGLEQAEVEVNPLYRFAKEFSAVLDINLQEYKKTREILFDCTMHYMANLDLRQGLSKQEYSLYFFMQDLVDGVCGNQAASVLRNFEKTKIRRLLRLILKLYQCGSSINLFQEVMRCMYHKSIVYANNQEIRQVLVYLGEKETEIERVRLEFLQDMFLPINYKMFLFWEHHFGIMDVDETMLLGEMVLF